MNKDIEDIEDMDNFTLLEKQIVKQYIDGKATAKELAIKHKSSLYKIYKLLRSAGIKSKYSTKKINKQTKSFSSNLQRNKALIADYASGGKVSTILKKYNISRQRLFQILRESSKDIVKIKQARARRLIDNKLFELELLQAQLIDEKDLEI